MKKVSLIALFAIFLASCSDETTVFNETSEDIRLENSEAILASSVLYDDAGVLVISSEAQISGKTAKGGNEEMAGDYPLTLIARVVAPSYNGALNLGASHVYIDGDYAYVSYNTVDGGYAGAIDIVFVGNPTSPILTSRLYYANADINSIAYDDGYVYAVGGVDSETSVRATSNSFLIKIPAVNGRMNTRAGLSFGFQEGFNATDIEVTDSSVIVGSGKDGYLRSYKKSDLSTEMEVPFADLRSIANFDGKLAVLDGSVGVNFLDANFNVTKEIAINSDFDGYSKRTLAVSDTEVIVSEGSKGTGIYNKSTGSLVKYLPILINPEGVEQANIVTNAVAMNENIVVMANGGAGLSLSENLGNGIEMVGVLDLNGSVNFVASKGDYIFVASGKAGLQIVKLNRLESSLEARCSNLPEYSGRARLTVAEGAVEEYSGSKRFSRVVVNGSLLLCGTWTVNNATKINESAIFEMKGSYIVGRNSKRKNVTVAKNAKLRIEGNLTVYGDLILEDGATLEFIGDSSTADIFGKVVTLGSAVVKGDLNDIKNKF